MGTVLTIAGFDPSSGAGVTADLAVMAAHGLFGVAAITALTVQTTVGVRSTHGVDPGVLRATLEALEEDLPADGIKIGMLGTVGVVGVVAEFLERLHGVGRRPVVVLDPVVRSSSGRALLEDSGVALLRERLLGLVDWVTPNGEEVAILGGVEGLRREYPQLGVVVTGGHLEPPDDLVLEPGADGAWLRGERVATTATHGTGCAFSSAMLSRLVLGDGALAAARAAKTYVAEAMVRAVPRGHGRGPMNLSWPIDVRR